MTWQQRHIRFGLASACGQSLVETALMVPLLLVVVLNAVNFGYFFLVAINLAAAPRSGVLYSIQGGSTPSGIVLPSAGPSATNTSISYLAFQDMTGALYAPSTQAAVQVCTQTIGLNNPGTATQTAQCQAYGTGTFPGPASDPESPSFVLNRVDVIYQFRPLINGTPFNITLLASPICTSSSGLVSCTFHRQASMRAMN
jgi:hypothetical protein